MLPDEFHAVGVSTHASVRRRLFRPPAQRRSPLSFNSRLREEATK